MTKAAGQTLRAMRPENWWFSKIPPLLAILYLGIDRASYAPGHAILMLACFACSISCVAAYGHVINDVCDVDTDLRAGKPNHMVGVGGTRRLALCLAFVLAGFAPTFAADYSLTTLVLLSLNYLWPTIYSLPGIRLKERGVAGLVCDALGSHVTPTLIALSLFGAPPPDRPFAAAMAGLFPVAITVWAAVLGLKGILHHQVADRANDLRSGTVTFATRLPPEAISRFLTAFNLYVELPVSAIVAMSTLLWAPLLAVALVIYCSLEAIKYRLGFQFALTAEAWTIRRSVPFINEAFYTLWLPFAAALQLAVSDRTWVWLPVVHLILFYRSVAVQVAEIKAIIHVADLPNRLAGRRR
ncbi:UbiA family prenyltransferase [Bradyrhizobium sp. 2TAF24]|uniref:UbiA family prenyltransferase n=1 Tax=Bradyrhizobium sp. 2TAF24 TaxID=3233011 RepID=UPI003F92E492